MANDLISHSQHTFHTTEAGGERKEHLLSGWQGNDTAKNTVALLSNISLWYFTYSQNRKHTQH